MIATPSISQARKLIDAARGDGHRIGFVPTMGALHEGHRSLIRAARRDTDFVVLSIFVNPAQFGSQEDLATYPRTFSDDLEACDAEGVDLVFHPDAEEMYPEPAKTRVVVSDLTEPMEGAFRRGHFDGVTLVCTKLFNIVGPCSAYFGEKDAQQLRVVRRMVRDLNLPVHIVARPTVRDADGLALSSRNANLDADGRERALSLIRALRAVEERVLAGEHETASLLRAGRAVLEAAGLDGIDYMEIVDPNTLRGVERVDGAVMVCGAVRVGETRLIDNVLVDATKERG